MEDGSELDVVANNIDTEVFPELEGRTRAHGDYPLAKKSRYSGEYVLCT